jgi:hypothetical protein
LQEPHLKVLQCTGKIILLFRRYRIICQSNLSFLIKSFFYRECKRTNYSTNKVGLKITPKTNCTGTQEKTPKKQVKLFNDEIFVFIAYLFLEKAMSMELIKITLTISINLHTGSMYDFVRSLSKPD